MKSKRNNVGLCPFLPMTRQNLDLGMEKCEINLSEKCEKRPLRTKVRYFQNQNSNKNQIRQIKRPLRIRVRLPVKSI